MEFYTKKLKWDNNIATEYVLGSLIRYEIYKDTETDKFIIKEFLNNCEINETGFETLEDAKDRCDYRFSLMIFKNNLSTSFYYDDIMSDINKIVLKIEEDQKMKDSYVRILKGLYTILEPLRHIESTQFDSDDPVRVSTFITLKKIFKVYSFNRIEQHLFIDLLLTLSNIY